MNPNTGSFGAAISNSPQDLSALKASMQSRGIDTSALDQMSGGSVAGTQVAPPMPSESTMAQAALPQDPAAGVTQPTAKEPDSDVTIAVKALGGLIKSDSDLKKSVVQMRSMGAV